MRVGNAELFRRGLEAWNRRDFDAALELYDPDAEWDNSRVFVDQEPLRGREALRAYWAEALGRWSEFEWVEEELIEGEGWVVAVVRMRATGSVSGIALDQRFAFLAELSDGRVTRQALYPTKDDALAAAEA